MPIEADSPQRDSPRKQAIPQRIWTKLEGYELELYHRAGHTVNFWVEDGELRSDPGWTRAFPALRPLPGQHSREWSLPISGPYGFGPCLCAWDDRLGRPMTLFCSMHGAIGGHLK